MLLQRLHLRNFRIFNEVEFDFCSGINLLYGANAQGKTTVLEAINLLMTGRSFRTTQFSDLIKEGEDFFFVEASFLKQGISQRLRISWNGKEKRLFYNQTELRSFSGLIGILQGVVMTPDDISIVKGAPVVRRALLDLQIAQIDPLYMHHLTRYGRAIKQRNVLLKTRQLQTIDGWEQEMANSAAYLIAQRSKILKDLQSSSNELHALLTDRYQSLSLDYTNEWKEGADIQALRQHCLSKWQSMRKKEMEIGFTLYGPHKDDFTIKLNGKETRLFASEGQQRSCVTALRLGEWVTMKKRADDPPLMLMDDYGISLDSLRRQHQNQLIEEIEQVFITSTEVQHFSKEQKAIFFQNNHL